MYYLTYSLKADSERLNSYYDKVKYEKEEVMNSIFTECREFIKDFFRYINRYGAEKVRTYEEYFIEFLLIGVLKSEYEQYIDNIGRLDVFKFDFLNNLRRCDLLKEKVDRLRGKMNLRILLRKRKKSFHNDLNIKNLIRWLKCSGDFEEECIRLENWQHYLEGKDQAFIKGFSRFIYDITVRVNY
ncbi:hypothetical protein [uncultured Clostridium sp.]|uniref:hypothetical protein n=1 Tax=uncultured Clostridium sp. TaxID=59620 RepID=UPI0025F9A87A|nr:hypothetical protein [uncultured Clostridium sp.]